MYSLYTKHKKWKEVVFNSLIEKIKTAVEKNDIYSFVLNNFEGIRF